MLMIFLLVSQMPDLESQMCFHNSDETAYLEKNESFSTLKTMICRKCSLQNLTQLSQGNHVLHEPVSKTDGCPWKDTCVSSTSLNVPLGSKKSQSPPRKLWFGGSTVIKFYINLTGRKSARCLGFSQRWYSSERYMGFKLCWIDLFRAHRSYTYSENVSSRKYSLKNKLSCHRDTMSCILLLLTKRVFFREMHVFLLQSWIGLPDASRAYQHIENCNALEVFLWKADWILTVKKCSRSSFY